MQHEPVIRQALVDVQGLLWANNRSTRRLPDHVAIASLRKIFDRRDVRDALEHGSDVVATFALRAVHHVVSEETGQHRATLKRLWDILSDPALNPALGRRSGPPIDLWLKKPPAR
jgi:hypothetical protein